MAGLAVRVARSVGVVGLAVRGECMAAGVARVVMEGRAGWHT